MQVHTETATSMLPSRGKCDLLLTRGWLFLTRHTVLVASSSSGSSSGMGGRMGPYSLWATVSWAERRA